MPEAAVSPPTYREIPLLDLGEEALFQLSESMKLSLSCADMQEVQRYFREQGREPTDVELEVFAQTWSEHCKHRIFGAQIAHTHNGKEETIESLFKTYIQKVTEEICAQKPDFVLSAFHDNAGFIRLDAERAVCLKVETHNHPSALEPYAGANTGLGGVIRDILGAGKGAKPIASLDVFCFGSPDTPPEKIKGKEVIHPLGILRGVVRGVRDYGNRMGIPTVSGALQFDDAYIYNPLVFCGTAGVIPIEAIEKKVEPGMKVIAVGGRTGRDGLHGATFSSAALDTESHQEDQQAVQIGNPIEEKKVSDFVLAAREEGLIGFVTDCGAGGFSSAAGEMLSEVGGVLYLERAPLKEEGLSSWEIFLSESQERMVLAVKEEALPRLEQLAEMYETELTVLGEATGSGMLTVYHHGERVCELDCQQLHEAPRKKLSSVFTTPLYTGENVFDEKTLAEDFKSVLRDFAIVSREPIIREYDHEVQGNTFQKPLAGAEGDAPQDAAIMHIDGSEKLMAMSLSLLPNWGKIDPYAMGRACVEETVRQLVCSGANPDKIALLDNFCLGNPHDESELGTLVEAVKGVSSAAREFLAPFISGKDSFYNYFETEEGPINIPVTSLVSGLGIVEEAQHILGSSLRSNHAYLCLLGDLQAHMGGSVYGRIKQLPNQQAPSIPCERALEQYREFYEAVKQGWILSAHDISEGGLAIAVTEMAFSLRPGVELDIGEITDHFSPVVALFNESPSCLVFEVSEKNLSAIQTHFQKSAFRILGRTVEDHHNLVVRSQDKIYLEEPLQELKALWKNGLAHYY